jgi:hypothetical protein
MRDTLAAEASSSRPASILSPSIDFLCVGGLSLIVLVPLLIIGPEQLTFVSITALVWLQALVNYTHFMASYRIIYRDREMIRRHQWAAIWVPLALFVLLIAAVATADQSKFLVVVFFGVSSAYLAWHYTGQVWGMMASHAYLAGVKYTTTERRLIRTSLRVLLAWHVVWFLHTALSDPSRVETVYRLVGVAAIGAFFVGLAGLVLLSRRTGGLPPARALVPWLAIFAWYAALARWGLPGLFLVQFFHALQYLEFPARVEMNRAARASVGRVTRHLAVYVAALVAASVVVLTIVPGPAMSIVANAVGASPTTVAPVLILYFINIHHYFTDGVVWKISNPEVRQELFAHVKRPEPAKASVTTAAVPADPLKRSSAARSKR